MTWRGASASRRRFQPVCRVERGKRGGRNQQIFQHVQNYSDAHAEPNRARTFKGEEDKEGKLVLLLLRVVDLAEEAKMIVGLQGVVIVGHDVREGVRYVAGSDDHPRLARLPG